MTNKEIEKLVWFQVRRIPNAHHYTWNKELRTVKVFFDNVHSKTYQLDEKFNIIEEEKL